MIIRITLDAIMIKVHNDIIVIITFSTLLSLKKLRHTNTRIRFRMLTTRQTVKKPSRQITLQRKEVTQLIGDELSNEEISEYFYFCLQRKDILEEWHKMYTEGKSDGGNV